MKGHLFSILHSLQLLRFINWFNRRKVSFICYHGVLGPGKQAPSDPYELHIPLELFQEQLDYIQRYHNVVSLNDFLSSTHDARRLPDYSVVLMFDDGFKDFFSVVASELQRRKLPATIFVITDYTTDPVALNGEEYLTWEEIEALAAVGVQIGSHTCTHPRLLDLPPHDIIRELANSKGAILSHVGQTDVALSYPFGQSSERISKIARSLGYCCAITGDLGPNSPGDDAFRLKRTVISSRDDVASFAARISGLTWWFSALRRLFRRPLKELNKERAVLPTSAQWTD